MYFFDIGNIAFEILQYQVSYVELIATLFGLISVYFASKASILTWGTGIVNEIFLFMLFFQVQLYPDMFLQVYFFVVTVYGWYHWKTNTGEKTISTIHFKSAIQIIASIVTGTLIAGYIFTNIHTYLPVYFKLPAAYPFTDSFIMVSSIVATVLLAKKKIENWYIWISLDAVCVVVYLKKEVYFLSAEYFIFLGLSAYGLYHWKKQIGHD